MILLLWGGVLFHPRVFAENSLVGTYYRNALSYITEGKMEQAEKLVRASLEFTPQVSDNYYLLFKIYENSDYPRSLEYFKKAAALDNWLYSRPLAVHIELGTHLFRSRSYKEAADLLDPHRGQVENVYDLALLLIKVYRALGNEPVESALLNQALVHYPDKEELYRIKGEFLLEHNESGQGVLLIEQGLRRNGEQPGLIFVLINLTKDKEKRLDLIKRYREASGKNPEAAVLALEAGAGEVEEYLRFFLENKGFENILLLDRVLQELDAREIDPALLLEDKLFVLTHGFADIDGDGYPEEEYFYKEGKLIRFVYDSDQNQVPDIEALFNGEVVIRQQDSYPSLLLTYQQYPYLDKIRYENPPREYWLADFAINHPLLSTFEGAFRYYINPYQALPDEADILKATHTIKKYDPRRGVLLSTGEIVEGALVREVLDEDGDGKEDHILNYKNRIIHSGLRDFDNDGEFETREVYSDGILKAYEIDENRDSRPDSIQEFYPQGEIRTLWDYNYDGQFDIRQDVKENEVTYFCSTGYNDEFDLFIRFVEGEIREISRKGQVVAVFPDPSGYAYWIGKRVQDFPLSRDLPQGHFLYLGKDYFIFKFDGKIYIEAVSWD